MRAVVILCALWSVLLSDAQEPHVAVSPAEANVAVQMRDGVVLRADVYRPNAPGPFPTLVYRTPYGKDFFAKSTILAAALARGYAVVGAPSSAAVLGPVLLLGMIGLTVLGWLVGQ